MAKISPVSIKYLIKAKFSADAVVERPDVIGAIFGQTEGLLGEDLELRELQKEGKIGRINVELSSKEGKTEGVIEIPCSLGKEEATIIGAALETIERIGPSNAIIQVQEIEDVRSSKREFIVARAKRLLEQINKTGPLSGEIKSSVRASSRIAKLQEYGKERLPAGPDTEGEELIVVEGRADVLNLLRNRIYNVIGMKGTSMPKMIKELGEEKKLTLFVDGDRGGELIAKNVIENAKIDFIAIAPAGKEVEELSGKELLTCLRKKTSVEESKRITKKEPKEIKKQKQEKKEPTEKEKEVFKNILYDLVGTKGACLVDRDLHVIKKVPLGELVYTLNRSKSVYALVLDDIATNSIIRAAEKSGCQHVIAKNFATTKTDINLVSL